MVRFNTVFLRLRADRDGEEIEVAFVQYKEFAPALHRWIGLLVGSESNGLHMMKRIPLPPRTSPQMML